MHVLMIIATVIVITVTVIALIAGLFLLLTRGEGRGE